MIFNRD